MALDIDDFIIQEIMLVVTDKTLSQIIEKVDKSKYNITHMTNEDILQYIHKECGYCDCCSSLFYLTDLQSNFDGLNLCCYCQEEHEKEWEK